MVSSMALQARLTGEGQIEAASTAMTSPGMVSLRAAASRSRVALSAVVKRERREVELWDEKSEVQSLSLVEASLTQPWG
jgi:hypothetical protein